LDHLADVDLGQEPERRLHIGVADVRPAVFRVAVAEVDQDLERRLHQVGERVTDQRDQAQRLQQRQVLGADDVVLSTEVFAKD
jgi:hypothetical protein